ncbi:MAG: hypothetical protein COC06_04915 [Bacteroidales bacterium]|nr:MAG: hypothetical protein COC06_04915 [Bacteroidales bacterium]
MISNFKLKLKNPRKSHYKKGEQAVKVFKKLPDLINSFRIGLNKNKYDSSTIYFQDESHFGFLTHIGRYTTARGVISNQIITELSLFVIDNTGFHSTKNIDIPENIKLVNIPPYNTPEFNPGERVWGTSNHFLRTRFLLMIEKIQDEPEGFDPS